MGKNKNKTRHLTPQGQSLKGSLEAIIGPRLAADQALKPGEIKKILLAVKPGPVKDLAPTCDALTAAFKTRLAEDADLSDLPEILEALKAAAEGEGEEDEDDLEDKACKDKEDLGMPITDEDEEDKEDALDEEKVVEKVEEKAEAEHPGVKLMKMLSKYDIPSEDLETINGLVTALGKKEAPMKGTEDNYDPKAMDAKLKGVETNTIKRLEAISEAKEIAAPFIGRVTADSAEKIYELILDSKGVKTKGIHPSAFKAMVGMLQQNDEATNTIPAMDAATRKSYDEMYPNRPMKA